MGNVLARTAWCLVIGEIDEDGIREMAIFKHEEVTRRQNMQVDFYVGVKAMHRGDKKKFRAQMKRCESTPGCEMENEFYLARHEVAGMRT
jgi:hypothetical protein